MKQTCITLCLALGGGLSGWAAGEKETARPSGLHKEPSYHSGQPLYGRIGLDNEGTAVLWAVLDSRKEGGAYDVLYLDRNADGDLTGEGERLVGEDSKFEIGEFRDPISGAVHTGMSLRFDRKDQDVFIRLDWNGKERIMGGYAPKPGPYLRFARKKEEAPLVQLVAEGPFTVQPWMLSPLKIGGGTDVKFFLGHAGEGTNAFAGLHQGFLPEGDGLKATLIYQTGSGEKRELVSKLLDRC